MCNAADNLWDALYLLAERQEGFFELAQAKEIGYSDQLLYHHLHKEKLERPLRGVYRLRHFPVSDNEDLVAIWLWTGREGVFSHETALALYQLSDVLPSQIHLTLPLHWRNRRMRYPDNVVPYFSELNLKDRNWHGCLAITSAVRTIQDCRETDVEPNLIEQAIHEGIQRGLFSSQEVSLG